MQVKGLGNLIYYWIKPFIPERVKLQLRRFLVKRTLKNCRFSWPIDPYSGRPPDGWLGWPEGKRFALVLTHDVETSEGLKHCHELMGIEESLGFRSSFNVVASDYQVSDKFRSDLKNRGFELGIHGLTHRGNPFISESVFKKQAAKINDYLNQLGCVGFRSPSMYHDLRLLHYLNIEYDASTFDTDPFEPQPDGIGTIFPRWIYDHEHQKGYVELPYTLPQDYLVFVVLGEKTIDLWKKKLDWVVAKGGMVLFIAHPDYMDFDNSGQGHKYPPDLYRQLLLYIQERYPNQYWNALPRELAKFWKANYSQKEISLKKRLHVGMPAYSFYELDNRIIRYARTLAKRGNEVEIFALRQEDQNPYEVLDEVKIHRLQTRKSKEKTGFSYLIRQSLFLWRSARSIAQAHRKKPFQLIHAHSIPDFEVFAAVFAKLKGSKVILDVHDLLPELYLSKFHKNKKSIIYRLLLLVERKSCKYADHVIIANHLWYEKLVSRSVSKDKCSVIMNYPEDSLFYPRKRGKQVDKFIMIYPGTLSFHQGLDLAIRAFAKITEKFPNAEFFIYGDGPERDKLSELIKEMKAENNIFIKDEIPLDRIPEIMTDSDLGIVPKRDDEFAGEAFSTKIFEFMAVGVPVLVSATRIDRHYFNDSVVKFFQPDDVEDLKKGIEEMITNEELRTNLAKNALDFVQKYKWSANMHTYLDIVDKLTK
ncbi:MAG: glycosyltransferase [Candidatus Aminicenantales bacterium]|jgi:glycosyltransferase involved in cell wall biosynthesis